jgi:hypothetical protein
MTSCSAFVSDVKTSCSTVSAAIDLLTCAQVSHDCSMGTFYQQFDTAELAALYLCGGACYQPCGLKAPQGSGVDAATPEDASTDAASAAAVRQDAGIADAAFDARG